MIGIDIRVAPPSPMLKIIIEQCMRDFREAPQYHASDLATEETLRGFNRRVHHWPNHVPDFLYEHWEELSDETRAAIWYICKDAANNEEWD